MRSPSSLIAAILVLGSSVALAQDRSGFPSARAPGSASAPWGFASAMRMNAVEPASAAHSRCDAPPPGDRSLCEPKICRLHTSTEKIARECFEIKCEAVCVPPVTFPWEKSPCSSGCADAGPAGRCGRVKYVHVPLVREYECGEKCVCEWKLEDACLDSPPAQDSEPAPIDAVPAAPDEARSRSGGVSVSGWSTPERRAASGWLRWARRN